VERTGNVPKWKLCNEEGDGEEREDGGVEEEESLPLVYLTGTVLCH
jgi:hypothetical protein